MSPGRPAFFASAAIAAGVMSGEPTICSCLRLDCTVLRPLTPIDDRDDAERDQNRCGDEASDFKYLAHLRLLQSRPSVPFALFDLVTAVFVHRPARHRDLAHDSAVIPTAHRASCG